MQRGKFLPFPKVIYCARIGYGANFCCETASAVASQDRLYASYGGTGDGSGQLDGAILIGACVEGEGDCERCRMAVVRSLWLRAS